MSACHVTTDPARIDRDLVHGFLAESYWSKGIPREVFERSIANALCFSLYDGEARYGFAPLAEPDRFMERWDPQGYQR